MQLIPRLFVTALLAGAAATGPVETRAQAPGSDTVRVNGIAMHYRVAGAGEPLLLLHGFGGCGDDWNPFTDELAKHYRLIIPDLPTHGATAGRDGKFSHGQAAADIFALLDSLGIERVRAMGISSGGMTLLHMATRLPERVEAMVLIGTTSHFPEPARVIFRDVAANGLKIPEVVEHFRRCATRGDAQMRELVELFGSFKDSHDDMDFNARRLAAVQARTLIIHGDRDEFFPVDIPVGMYQGIPESALWIVPNGDHVPIYGRRARQFLDVALNFLGGAVPAHESAGGGAASAGAATGASSAAPEGATFPASGVAVDHVFIAVAAADTAAFAALRRAGLNLGADTSRHEGQGTASVSTLLGNMYLELIWADPDVSLDSAAASLPEKIRTAARRRTSGPSPFGIGMRRGPEPVDYGVPVTRHTGEWMEPGTALEILTQPDEPDAVDVFVVPEYMAMPSWLPMVRTRAPHLLQHALGVQSVTRIELQSPASHRPAALRTLSVPDFSFIETDELLLVLQFDGGVRGERIDLRPALPLVLVR